MSRKWTAGDEYNAGTLNEVPDALQSLLRPVEVWLERQLTAQTFTASVPDTPYPTEAFVFDTARVDTHEAWDQADKSAITIPKAGWYDIHYGSGFTPNSSASAMLTFTLSVNGTLADTSTAGYADPYEMTRGEQRNVISGSTNLAYRRRASMYLQESDVLRMRFSSYDSRTTMTTEGRRPALRLRWVSQ